ncbi:hypothetical protein [Labedella endophytica]|uniref:Uncharacterized protein n=1 Tax=Labedella endophytica TaxID=1523160 RepID=A0A433JT09_9MICO|nr:hypothetical protein [Labedella endophytica]RUR00999.1 hypothetical protein ELQ94_05545 [Labedella endophytica]
MIAPSGASTTGASTTGASTGEPTAPRALVLFAIGAGCAILGLLPWIITGMRLPLQNLWEGPAPEGGMPIALLPFSQYAVTLIVALIAVGSLFAGMVARLLRRRNGFRVWPIVVGVALVQVVALIQTVVVVSDGLAERTESTFYLGGLTAGTAFAIVVGLVILLLVARAPRGVATVAIAAIGVPIASWVGGLIIPFGTSATASPAQVWLIGFYPWFAAVVVGTTLAWCGLRPAARAIAWVLSLGLLWIGTAISTAASAALGTRILASRPAEMLDYGLEVFRMALSGEANQGPSILAALVIGLVGTSVREIVLRSRMRRSAD